MTCEKVGRGRRSIPLPNASQKICITTALGSCMVCAAVSAFLLYQADHACVYAAGFVSRSAHFVFTGQRAPVEAETGFFAPYMACPVCEWEPQTGPPRNSFISVFPFFLSRTAHTCAVRERKGSKVLPAKAVDIFFCTHGAETPESH